MVNREAYNEWADSYDRMPNKTRDLEAVALRAVLGRFSFDSCLEIGCGTGKNTSWLASRTSEMTAVDFSEEMISRARTKVMPEHLNFVVADVTESWNFTSSIFDLISFSLVLEHIEDLEHIFKETSKILAPGGLVYIGELHPYKQYKGSKARFENAEGKVVLDCFTHHLSDYVSAARKFGLKVEELKEFFVPGQETQLPQIFALLLKRE